MGKERRPIELGLLYSRSGGYSLFAEACRSGALGAIAQVNANPAFDLVFLPVERDPGGDVDRYAPLCEDLLRNTGARHIIGCVTSSSRKEVIPVLEKHGGTLWYALPYEGFEASDHVVYTHACPNQHLLPLLDWALPTHGARAYLTGSNYIWGWEMNRLARERITSAGGTVVGERYLPLGSTEVGRMVEEIRAARPAFILNNLVGPSSYEFITRMQRLATEDPALGPDICPILSCNLTEAELPALGAAAEGLVSAGPYFRGDQTGGFGSSPEAAAHRAVTELALLLNGRPGAERSSLPALLDRAGSGLIDQRTHHTALPVVIARVEGGAFRTVKSLPALPGDPYLTRERGLPPAPQLRVVS